MTVIVFNRCVRCGASTLLDERLCPVCVDYKPAVGMGPAEERRMDARPLQRDES